MNTFPGAITIEQCSEQLVLLPGRAIYQPRTSTLIVGDVHLGKISHFRRSGIALPHEAALQDIQRLSQLMALTAAERCLILGDLFHSSFNNEWRLLEDWRREHAQAEVVLVQGNHDILPREVYIALGIQVAIELREGPFVFRHRPDIAASDSVYLLCGHIHPAVRLTGTARAEVKLPCFFFGARLGILPAFGEFTGTATMNAGRGDRVFVIAGDEVVEV